MHEFRGNCQLVTLLVSGAVCCLAAASGQCEDAPPMLVSPEPLLDDAQFVEQFVAQFPVEDYKVYAVADVGKFYLKDPDKDTFTGDVDFVKDTIRRGEIWEKNVHLAIAALTQPGTVALDVGAHIGAHTVTMAKLVGPQGKVYAFEPQLDRFRDLSKNLELNDLSNAVPLRYAVGDKHDVIEISREHVADIGSGGEQAELRTIDSFGFTNVSLIKIDVESYEDFVIDGAQETIRKYRPYLLVEIQGGTSRGTASPEQLKQIENTIAKLESFDYKVVSIGRHDYLATPTERERAANRALKRELGQPGGWSSFLLPGTLFALVVVVVIVTAIVWWRQR